MRRLCIALAALGLATLAEAQVTMRDELRIMPDSLTPYLTENNRLDCIDFLDSNMKAEVHNALDGKSQLLTLTEHYAKFQLSEAHVMELRLLDTTVPVDSCRQVLCLVSTVGKDVQESTISFYSVRWKPLSPHAYMSLPVGIFTAALDEREPQLTITSVNYLDCLAMEGQQPLSAVPINLKWRNNSFK